MSDSSTEVELAGLSPDEAERLRAALEKEQVRVQEPEVGVEDFGITLLVFIGAGALVTLVFKLWREKTDIDKGGQIVDMSGDKLVMRRDEGLQYGLVVIIAKDGKITVEVKEPKSAFSEIWGKIGDIITDLGKAGIDAIKKAVEGAVGDKATVTQTA